MPPAAERRRPGPAVEAGIELSRAEGSRIAGQPVTGRKPRSIQLRVPVIIAATRRAGPDHDGCPSPDRQVTRPPPAPRPGGWSVVTSPAERPAARPRAGSWLAC